MRSNGIEWFFEQLKKKKIVLKENLDGYIRADVADKLGDYQSCCPITAVCLKQINHFVEEDRAEDIAAILIGLTPKAAEEIIAAADHTVDEIKRFRKKDWKPRRTRIIKLRERLQELVQ